MNKARRHELKMLHYKKRLRKYGIDKMEPGVRINANCFRSTGNPCSCWLCSPSKYKTTGTKKAEYKGIQWAFKEAC